MRTVLAVVLDAANIACHNRGGGASAQWYFERVERVKAECARLWPDARVRAMIDASAEHRLSDRDRSERAHQEGWLKTAPGDADDLVLQLADDLGAPIVSRDNFVEARRSYPWLERETGRVWSFSIQRDETVLLRPRRLVPATDEEVAQAKRRKARKAGDVSLGEDERWLCTAPPDRCSHAGQPVPVIERIGRRLCRFCSHVAEEQVYDPEPAAPPGPPGLLLSVDGLTRRRLDLPPDGLLLGRGGPRRPEVTDVTADLERAAAYAISKHHLHVELDDEGWPVVVHRGESSVTFLNPHMDDDGLPADNRLVRGERYPLCEGDELVLGEGRVRLVVSCAEEPR